LFGAPDAPYSTKGLAFAAGGRRLVLLRERLAYQFDRDGVADRHELGESTTACALSPDGQLVAAYTSGSGLSMHDLSSGKSRPLSLPEPRVEPVYLSFGPDSRTLLAWDRHLERVLFWDVRERRFLRGVTARAQAQGERYRSLRLSPDGKVLAGDGEAVARLWDAHTGQPVRQNPGHVRAPEHLSYSSDGRTLTSVAEPGEVYRWEVASGRPLARTVIPQAGRWGEATYRLAPGGGHLAERTKHWLRLFDTRTGKDWTLINGDAEPADVTFTPDGRTVAAADRAGVVRLWDLAPGKRAGRLDLGKQVRGLRWLCFSPDGKRLATGESMFKVHLWDARTGRHLGALEPSRPRTLRHHDRNATWSCFSADGRMLFTSNMATYVTWDIASGKDVEPYDQDESSWGSSATTPLAVSPDGRLLAWFDEALRLRLSETATGKIVHRFEGGFKSIAFAPSGWRLATACQADGSVLVWDLQSLFLAQPDAARGPPSRERLWADLADRDAAKAHRAVWRLAVTPGMEAFLARQMKPVPKPEATRLRRWIAELGSDGFATRQQAERALAAAGDAAGPALREAHRKAGDLERRQRLGRLLARLEPRSPERLRQYRAVFALEARGSAEARRLPGRLADGMPGAPLTEEAKAALARTRP
jgi:WD40 repeat protein